MPRIKTIGTLYLIGSEDSIYRKEELIRIAKTFNITVEAEGYNDQTDIPNAAAALLSKKIDAVVHLQDPAQDVTFPVLYNNSKSRKIPVFSVVYNMEKLGAVIVCSPDRDEASRKFAGIVIKIMKGGDPSTMPFENDNDLKKNIAINKFAANDAGLEIPESLYSKAYSVVGR